MTNTLTARVTAVLFALSIAVPALAQSTMVRGKVIDAKKEPLPGVTIVVESLGGSGRKLTTKTDRKGEFVQLLTESGVYRITATDPKIGFDAKSVRAGEEIGATLTGFGPDSTVSIWLDGERLTDVTVDADGAATMQLQIPADADKGKQRLVVKDSADTELVNVELQVKKAKKK